MAVPAESLKELKVNLPMRQAERLFAMKIVQRRRSISDVVIEALDSYFAQLEAVEAARRGPP